MKSKKLVNFLIGTSILFSGCNVQKNIIQDRQDRYLKEIANITEVKENKKISAQELDLIKQHIPIVGKINYISDYETYGKKKSYWQTREETIKRDSGNCSDKTILFSDVLDSLGIEHEIVYGKLEPSDTAMHMWAKVPGYILECSGKGTIYDEDSIKNIPGNPKYLSTNINTAYMTEKIIDYYNRTGKILNIKGFEPLTKTLQK